MKPFTFEALAQKVRDVIDSPHGSVLLVEGDATVRALICEALSDSELRIEVAATAREALNKISAAQGRYDAVVLDDELPDRPGDALFRELRALYSDLPVIIASTHRPEQLSASFAKDRCLAVIAKPYSAAQLQETMAAVGVRCRGRT